ncbi:MAG: PAS domain S-box protein [Cyanobacteria bacterium P01_D01_bin.105]
MRPSPTADSQRTVSEEMADVPSPTNLKTEPKTEPTVALQDARTIFDHLQEAIFIHDTDFKILDVNAQVLKLFRITREEALSYRIDKEYATEESPIHLIPDLFQRAMNGETVRIGWPGRRPSDGSRLYLEVTLQKVMLSGQVRLMASVRDVTERKQMKLEQKRLLSILEATPDLVGMADMTGQCLYLNRAGRKMIGLAEDAPVGFHIDETLTEQERSRFLSEALPQAIEHGSYCSEASVLTREGEELPVSRVVLAHKNDAGATDCLSVVMRDIKAQKETEAQLRDREQFLNSIYTGADIVIFAWDLLEGNELRCAGWNPTCETATGMRADTVLGKTPYEVFGEEQGAAVASNNLQCAAKKQSMSYEEEIVIEGSPTWWATTLNPIQDSEGRVYRVVGTTTNITALKLQTIELEAYSKRQAEQTEQLTKALAELRQTQAQMIQNEKMSSLGEMVAGIAHEINNPVNFIHANIKPASDYAIDLINLIKGYQQEHFQPSAELEALLEDLDFDFIQKDFLLLLSSMKVGTQRIREIVLSLRNFSRLDEADVKAADIAEGIDSTLVILSHKLRENARQKPIEIIKAYQPMPLVECYPSQLNQAIMNIVANAIDALSESLQPQISITTQAQASSALITIADNGTGMPESVQERIFNPFYTTKPVGKGTGMGLSISYQIVTQKHGGELSVNSTPGQGTTFTIEIPLKQASIV